jgi:nitroreductase
MLSLIKRRRSIRIFQDKKVEKTKIDQIVQAALLSPSSKNNNPWKFIIVDDKEVLKELSDAKEAGSQFLAKAPIAVVVLADPEQSDVWIEDASIATTILIMAAQNLELGSCWIQIRERNYSDEINSEEFVKNILGIPKKLRVLCIVAIGYPGEEKSEKQIEERKLDDIYQNHFGNKMRISNIY